MATALNGCGSGGFESLETTVDVHSNQTSYGSESNPPPAPSPTPPPNPTPQPGPTSSPAETLSPDSSFPAPPFPSAYTAGSLRVCKSGCPYQLPSQALAAATAGSVVELEAGDYADCIAIAADNITVRGIGGYVRLSGVCGPATYFNRIATKPAAHNTTLEFFELSACDSPSNGIAACIAHHGVNLTLRWFFVHDTSAGFGTNSLDDTINIESSRFDHIGAVLADGRHRAAQVSSWKSAELFIRGTYITRSTHEGNEIWSRSMKTTVDCSLIANLGESDTIPLLAQFGGVLTVTNSVLARSGTVTQRQFISIGNTSGWTNSVTLTGNTFIDDTSGGSVIYVTGSMPINISNNLVIGPSRLLYNDSTYKGVNNQQLASRPSSLGPYPNLPKPGPCTTAWR